MYFVRPDIERAQRRMGITSQEFRKRRQELGLTQEALARRLDITLRAVTLIEKKPEVPERYVLALAGIEAEQRAAANV